MASLQSGLERDEQMHVSTQARCGEVATDVEVNTAPIETVPATIGFSNQRSAQGAVGSWTERTGSMCTQATMAASETRL